MSVFERLLLPGAQELPDCRYGAEMTLAGCEPTDAAKDVEIRVYQCPACRHELRLTVWAIEA